MGVALVPHIEHQPVPAGIKNPVNGHDQLHRPQAGGQMPPCTRHRIQQPGAEQGAEDFRLVVVQAVQVFGTFV